MIYLFNPETDLALANGGASYTPPLRIATAMSRLALLPALYAPAGSEILVRENDMTNGILRDIAYSRDMKVVNMSEIYSRQQPVSPWGWNLALRNELLRAGVADTLLPSKETLSVYRDLSHRRTSIKINRLLGSEGGTECFTADEALAAISGYGNCVIKSPWSSSGRGVWMTHNINDMKLSNLIKNVLLSQGSVLIERYIEKKIDCATEWIYTQGKALFKGLSVFNTDEKGKYFYNIISSQSELRDMFPEITDSLIAHQQTAIEKTISTHYEGPLGVDMMIAKNGEVIPCVEVNLRMTMGYVALELWRNFRVKINFSPWNGLNNLGISV